MLYTKATHDIIDEPQTNVYLFVFSMGLRLNNRFSDSKCAQAIVKIEPTVYAYL